MRKQQGLSLVELMISITLGLVLMTGVMQMFLSSRTVFSTHQAISRIQESGRLAMEFMSRDIRMAGYMGCMSRATEVFNTLNNSTDALYDFNMGIEGVTVASNGTLPARFSGILNNPVPDSDVLIVRSANGSSAGVTQNNNGAQIFLDHTGEIPGACPNDSSSLSGLCAGDIVVVSDCEKARVFQITNLTATGGATQVNAVHSSAGNVSPGNAISSWGGNSAPPEERFGPDSEVIKLSTTIYFVAENASGGRSLWQKIGSQPAQELLEGVADMRISYGIDAAPQNGVPDQYVAASTISGDEWHNVLSVRVQLLLESLDDNVLEEPQPYTFNGQSVTPTDRRMRQVFVNTIGIRSRLP